MKKLLIAAAIGITCVGLYKKNKNKIDPKVATGIQNTMNATKTMKKAGTEAFDKMVNGVVQVAVDVRKSFDDGVKNGKQ